MSVYITGSPALRNGVNKKVPDRKQEYPPMAWQYSGSQLPIINSGFGLLKEFVLRNSKNLGQQGRLCEKPQRCA